MHKGIWISLGAFCFLVGGLASIDPKPDELASINRRCHETDYHDGFIEYRFYVPKAQVLAALHGEMTATIPRGLSVSDPSLLMAEIALPSGREAILTDFPQHNIARAQTSVVIVMPQRPWYELAWLRLKGLMRV